MPAGWHVPRLSRRWAAQLAGGATVVSLVTLGQLVDPDAVPLQVNGLTVAIAALYTPMAVLVLAGVPGHLVGRLMAAAGGTACAAVLTASWSGWAPVSWLSRWLWWPPLGLIFLALLVFPDGHLPSRRWRPLAIVIVVATVVAAAALAAVAVDRPDTLLEATGSDELVRVRVFSVAAKVSIVVVSVCSFGVLYSLWHRWRHAAGETAQQLACLLPAGVLLLLTLVLETRDLTGAWVAAAVVVPVAMAVAVLRYRLYDLDQVINRSIVWLVMTLLVIVGFVAIVAVIRDVLGFEGHVELATTGLIAVAFEPLRRRVQRAVDRLLYGEREDPYQVIGRLNRLLSGPIHPHAVVPELATTISRSLQLPYVAVEVDGPAGPRVIAEHGRHATATESFDMVTHGQRIGRLIVANRELGGHFTPRECRILADAAVYAAVAAEATRLIRDLQASREGLVVAREEERLRLRRDLHDGVGPALAGMSMQVRAALKLIDGSPRVMGILDNLAVDLQDCNVEMHQLVDQLRPPALDHGLVAALGVECRRFASTSLDVTLSVEGRLDGLPAAIEVAVYRIVAEALTNVARHARARTCRVAVARARDLTVEIVDDGVGFRDRGSTGVGVASMRDRAAELGGSCATGPATPRGTAVRVRLPIPLPTEPMASS